MSIDQQKLKKAFDTFDIDKSGAISTSELCTVLNQCGVKVSQAQCSLLIGNYDTNESGLMEFDRAYQKIRGSDANFLS